MTLIPKYELNLFEGCGSFLFPVLLRVILISIMFFTSVGWIMNCFRERQSFGKKLSDTVKNESFVVFSTVYFEKGVSTVLKFHSIHLTVDFRFFKIC